MSATLDLDGVFEALARQRPRIRGPGRSLMFVAAQESEDSFALMYAAARARRSQTLYAIDLDVRRNRLARKLRAEGATLGPRIDARLGGVRLFEAVSADGVTIPELRPTFSFHRVDKTRLFIGGYDARGLPKDLRVRMCDAPGFWTAARAGGALTLVDAPSLDRSRLGLLVARHMDGVVLVVGDGADAAPAAMRAKAQLRAAGADLLGIVYAGASAPVMAMRRLWRQAG